MSLLSSTTKLKLGAKATKHAARNPALVKFGAQAGMPVARLAAKAQTSMARRRARRRVGNLGEAVRSAGETLVTYGPQAARELGLVEAPKPKRTAPRLAAGVVLGASAVYFLEPEHGKEHREKVAQLVS